jgi:hypothetical protein
MAIYTTLGEEVKVVGRRIEEGNFIDVEVLTVKSVNDPSWIRERRAFELKADGGINEIDKAIQAL